MIEGLLLLLELYLLAMLLRALKRVSKNLESESLGLFVYHEDIASKDSKILKKAKNKGGYA